jgi:hypothetical protein
VSEIDTPLMKLGISPHNLQGFILKIPDLMKNMSSSESVGKANLKLGVKQELQNNASQECNWLVSW